MNSEQRLKKLEQVIKLVDELRASYEKTEELNEYVGGTLNSAPFKIIAKHLKWAIRFEKNRSCPKCNSKNLFHQRRPNGNTECGDCDWTGKTKECED